MEGFATIEGDTLTLAVKGLPAKFVDLSLEELALGIGKSIEKMNSVLEDWEKTDGSEVFGTGTAGTGNV